mmetsp:Transcript_48423/g.77147  ORF Transcript_48423/g.77147 Transcript_48423/m.77147 type:complete len:81 (-) Transcript_48423:7-249(-)
MMIDFATWKIWRLGASNSWGREVKNEGYFNDSCSITLATSFLLVRVSWFRLHFCIAGTRASDNSPTEQFCIGEARDNYCA